MAAYTSEVTALKAYVTNRYRYLTNHTELLPSLPRIVAVYEPESEPTPADVPYIAAQVQATVDEGIDSVWQ